MTSAAVRSCRASAPWIRACSSGSSRPSVRAWVTRPASSSAVKTVLTASVASIRHSRRITFDAHCIAASSGLVAMQNASIGGPSQSTARSGPARVRFFGTISPITVCRNTTTPSASTNATGCTAPLGQPERVERRLQQVGQRRLGDRAQAQRADRDAELGAGDHQRDLVHRATAPSRARRLVRGQRLDDGAAGGDQRELAADEEARCRAAAATVTSSSVIGAAPAARRPGPARSGAGRPRRR